MDKTDKIKQEEFPLPRYVQEVLSKHNISLPSLWGRGKGEGLVGWAGWLGWLAGLVSYSLAFLKTPFKPLTNAL